MERFLWTINVTVKPVRAEEFSFKAAHCMERVKYKIRCNDGQLYYMLMG